MVRTLTVYGRDVKFDGNKHFIEYQYVTNTGIWYQVKFTQDVTNKPNIKGYVDLLVDTADVSIQRKKVTLKDGREYKKSILWIKNLKSFTENEARNAELQKKHDDFIKDIFGLGDLADVKGE